MSKRLSKEELQKYVVDGFHVIKPQDLSVDSQFHHNFYEKLIHKIQREGNPGNNISPMMPEMKRIFQDSAVVGTLQSILGEDYNVHAHRHAHLSQRQQRWHRDTYWGNRKDFNLEPRWVMLMYYPQTVTETMGPTELIAGSHYYTRDGKNSNLEANDIPGKYMRLCVEAGTIAVIDYHLWHRGTKPTSKNSVRYMLKYQFYRTKEPKQVQVSSPTQLYICPSACASYDAAYLNMYQFVWDWLNGMTSTSLKLESRLSTHSSSNKEMAMMSRAFCSALNDKNFSFLTHSGERGREGRYTLMHQVYYNKIDERLWRKLMELISNAKSNDYRWLSPLVKCLQVTTDTSKVKDLASTLLNWCSDNFQLTTNPSLLKPHQDRSVLQISVFPNVYMVISVVETLVSCFQKVDDKHLRNHILKQLHETLTNLLPHHNQVKLKAFACQFVLMSLIFIVDDMTPFAKSHFASIIDRFIAQTQDRYILAYSTQWKTMTDKMIGVKESNDILLTRWCPYSNEQSPF